jgi:LAS superfamily LD-carboxypeptidase LdcB
MHAELANFPRLELSALTGLSSEHVVSIADPPCTLHQVAANAMQQLRTAAMDSGIELAPVSSFRSFEQQLGIWNQKFRGLRPLLSRDGQPLDALALDEPARVEAILLWSALPGGSRHHWGTDFDVIDRAALAPGQQPQLLPTEYAAGGCFEALSRWLDANAADFGFFRPYDADRGGVQPEPWHLSFAPIATGALVAHTPEVLASALATSAIEGSNTVYSRLPELHQRFVLAVAPASQRALRAGSLSRAARPS